MSMFFHDLDEEIKSSNIFGPKMGTWIVSSKTDPRWNNSGRGEGLICCGGPSESKKWINECIEKFGDQPLDLYYSFWKD